jgi:broad specificity phosphatase PhoE
MPVASTRTHPSVPVSVFDGGMGELLAIRHGQTEWSKSGQHTSVTDLPLLPEGEEQARNLGKSLAGRRFVEVWASPRQRALRTAELAGLTPTRVEEDLVEVDYGGYEGRTTPEIRAALGRPWTLWEDGTVPGASPGETMAAVAARVDRVLAQVKERLADGDVALVAHGHVLRVLTARWLGLRPEHGALFPLPAGSYGVLGYERERQVLTGWGLH